MTTEIVTTKKAEPKVSLLAKVADRYSITGSDLYDVLAETIFPSKQSATKSQVQALLIVADQYKLNPFTKEIYAFPAKGKGVVPILSVDGWMKLANEHPMCNGIQCIPNFVDDQLVSCTATVWRKDRDHPVTIVETLAECRRPTEPWKTMPNRMLRHRAVIQAIRYAFGFAGIYDPDEGEVVAAGGDPARTENELTAQLNAEIEARRASADEEAAAPIEHELDYENEEEGTE